MTHFWGSAKKGPNGPFFAGREDPCLRKNDPKLDHFYGFNLVNLILFFFFFSESDQFWTWNWVIFTGDKSGFGDLLGFQFHLHP